MITIVLGTKAEFLRLFPLMLYLQRKKADYALIHTCQHELGDYVERFEVKPSERIELTEFKETGLTIKGGIRGARLYYRLKRLLRERSPSWTVYQGDTFTTGVVSFAAKAAGARSAHVEAGFRSGSWREPFPEETIRKLADHRADLLFAPSRQAALNLHHENVKGKIVTSGSTIRDSVEAVVNLPNRHMALNYVAMTMHRYENLFSEERMRKIITIVNSSSTPVLWSMHEHTKKRLKSMRLLDKLDRSRILPAMEYPEFMNFVSQSRYTMTDGGSLQEESIVLGRKCLLLRKTTERMEAVEGGMSYLSRLDIRRAARQMKEIDADPFCDASDNPYQRDRPASEVIGDALLE